MILRFACGAKAVNITARAVSARHWA